MLFFFFQAEDGIRDHCVTGVQTCALPIFGLVDRLEPADRGAVEAEPFFEDVLVQLGDRDREVLPEPRRSEERRVGKECRSRWWRYQRKEKQEQEHMDQRQGGYCMMLKRTE